MASGMYGADRVDLVCRLSGGGDPNSVLIPGQAAPTGQHQPEPASLVDLISQIVGANKQNQDAYGAGQSIDPTTIQQMLQKLGQIKQGQ